MSEMVYLGHDNTIYLVLKEDGVAQSLAAVSRIDLNIDDGEYEFSSADSSDGSSFDWDFSVTGGVLISLGQTEIEAGTYRARLVVYDPTNAKGIVWGDFDLMVD